jgi:hypothetical protein
MQECLVLNRYVGGFARYLTHVITLWSTICIYYVQTI